MVFTIRVGWLELDALTLVLEFLFTIVTKKYLLTPVPNFYFTIVTKKSPTFGMKGEMEILIGNSTKVPKLPNSLRGRELWVAGGTESQRVALLSRLP